MLARQPIRLGGISAYPGTAKQVALQISKGSVGVHNSSWNKKSKGANVEVHFSIFTDNLHLDLQKQSPIKAIQLQIVFTIPEPARYRLRYQLWRKPWQDWLVSALLRPYCPNRFGGF